MIPVLWLTGPPGVGKTAVAWEIYQRLQRAGDDVAYVDVDQLGICYPPPAGDPDRHGLKARNVAALRANFAAAGARTLIVSGVVDAERGPDIDAIGGPPTAIVRLRADPDELRARLRRRDGASAQHEAALEEARAFDGSGFADRCVDTTGLSIGESASRVLGEIGDWPPVGNEAAGAASSSAAERRDAVGVRDHRRRQVDGRVSRLSRRARLGQVRRRTSTSTSSASAARRPTILRCEPATSPPSGRTSTRSARGWPSSPVACRAVPRRSCMSRRCQACGCPGAGSASATRSSPGGSSHAARAAAGRSRATR